MMVNFFSIFFLVKNLFALVSSFLQIKRHYVFLPYNPQSEALFIPFHKKRETILIF